MSKRILVTGITGFIGRVLTKYLLQDPNVTHITGVDNLINSKYSEDDPLFQDPRVDMNICSVSDYNPTELNVEEIYHLASPVGPVGVLKWAGSMGPMIVDDTARMAKLALKTGAKLIDISTSEVYGANPHGVPQVEDLNKVVPSNITVRLEYGVAKLLCEIFLTNMTRTTDLKCNMIRPYNIVSYGQQASAGFVLPRFIEQALSGEDITVYPPGEQRRTFTDVHDFVEGIMAVMAQGENGQIYNVGNPVNLHSIMELAEMVKETTKSSSDIKIVDPKKLHGDLFEEAWEKIPNIDRIQRDTDWKPYRTLKDIVDFAVAAYQKGDKDGE
jgi:nucleoside-diphosphate-sugar epimerase